MNKSSALQRDTRIDTMRMLGTLLVMLAHVAAPSLIQKIRGFDVVMLVFISGLSFYTKKDTVYRGYLWQRVKKLVFPTYGIITCLFAAAFVACAVVGREQLFSWDMIWRSYLFADGVGYIWIVKAYMLIAVVSPLLYRVAKQIKSDFLFFALIAGTYGIYHIAMLFLAENVLLYQYIFQIFPYTLIACIGMRSRDDVAFRWKALLVAAIIVVADVTVRGGFVIEQFKHPPQYNYLSYGLFAALLFYQVLPDRSNSWIRWFSKNSFMVYLFHIIFVLATNFVAEIKVFSFVGIWYIQLIIVVTLSVAATWLMNKVGAILSDKKGIYSK